MTNRLKILSAILVISLFIFGNSLINDPTKQKKEIVSAKTNTAPISKESTNQPVINSNSKNNYKSFKPISDDKKNDFVWTRNPFDSGLGKKTTINSSSTSELQSQPNNSNNPLVKQSDIQGVTDLKIESVAIIGETAIVIINGYRYREGDRISSLTIDKIEPNKITFRSGRTQIIRDVGT